MKAAASAADVNSAPRLLNIKSAATYLSCSTWTVREWILAGRIPVVRLPALRPREGQRPHKSLRRVLVDVRDLDAFIDALPRDGQ